MLFQEIPCSCRPKDPAWGRVLQRRRRCARAPERCAPDRAAHGSQQPPLVPQGETLLQRGLGCGAVWARGARLSWLFPESWHILSCFCRQLASADKQLGTLFKELGNLSGEGNSGKSSVGGIHFSERVLAVIFSFFSRCSWKLILSSTAIRMTVHREK